MQRCQPHANEFKRINFNMQKSNFLSWKSISSYRKWFGGWVLTFKSTLKFCAKLTTVCCQTSKWSLNQVDTDQWKYLILKKSLNSMSKKLDCDFEQKSNLHLWVFTQQSNARELLKQFLWCYSGSGVKEKRDWTYVSGNIMKVQIPDFNVQCLFMYQPGASLKMKGCSVTKV